MSTSGRRIRRLHVAVAAHDVQLAPHHTLCPPTLQLPLSAKPPESSYLSQRAIVQWALLFRHFPDFTRECALPIIEAICYVVRERFGNVVLRRFQDFKI